MWLHFLCLTLSIYCGHAASVFLGRDQAHGLLLRPRRANSGWLEELKKGDLERECLEEKCSKEEVREVFEHDQATEEFWKNYNVIDSCKSAPCQNNGRCSNVSGKTPPYTCLCLQGISGRNCELVFQTIPVSCSHENGGCEHFCEQEVGRRSCSCAEGYFLGPDRQHCLTEETIACGKVPVLGGMPEDRDNPLSPRSRIVGGTECPKGQCPWQVLLVRNGKGFCGGVLYKPYWILTASHCLENIKAHQLQVVAGEHDTEVEEGTEQTMDVAEVIMHNRYELQTSDSDIALLRLKKPIVITPFAVPVCLPTRSMAVGELWGIHLHTVSGWGRRSENGPTSRVLRRLNVPRIRSQECVEKSGVTLTTNMFCAGYIEGKQDSCKGDSGGPLVTRYKNTTFLLGIVSWGRGCAQPGNYGIYTRVSNYLDWIHNNIAKESTKQPQNPALPLKPAGTPKNTIATLINNRLSLINNTVSLKNTTAHIKNITTTTINTVATLKNTTFTPKNTNNSLKNTTATLNNNMATPIYTSATPINTSATSINTSATPINTSATSINTSATSINTSATPINTSATSINTSATPINTSATSINTSVTPINTSATPINTSATSINTSATPINTSATPKNTSATPINTSATPINTFATPINTSATPINSSATPINTSAIPKKGILNNTMLTLQNTTVMLTTPKSP